jgi:hypothetical protein
MTAPDRRARLASWTRVLGAAALLAVGLDHLDELTSAHYSQVPTIGTLFALNFAAATLVAVGLAARIAPAVLAATGMAIAGGSLTALLVSESGGLFGFREYGYRGAIVLAIALDGAALVLLAAHLLTARRRPGRGARA